MLPFTSLSSETDNVVFADGIHGDILTQLASIGSCKVISRTSVMEYRNTTKNVRQIGEELDVDTVLQGSVQREARKCIDELQEKQEPVERRMQTTLR